MTKTEFNKRLTELVQFMSVNTAKMEPVNDWMGQRIPNAFAYGTTSEYYMEHKLSENGKERKTTFMSDLSIGEWGGGRKGVLDTCKRAMKSWKDNEVYMAELILCVNWKAWEHDARGNNEWAKFYSILYGFVRGLVYEYYDGDDEKTAYVYDFID